MTSAGVQLLPHAEKTFSFHRGRIHTSFSLSQGEDTSVVDQATSLGLHFEGPILAPAKTIENSVKCVARFSGYSVLRLNADLNFHSNLQCLHHLCGCFDIIRIL